ncbi:hypothetical protein [Flavobacterium sp.]|uniref:hypothetical protein n=1 Tax=Flavobacterium sp. TaxID=239 RepID=UPI003F6A5172
MPITYNIETNSIPGNIAVFKDDQGLITEDSGFPLTSKLVAIREMSSVGNITPGSGISSDLVDSNNLYGSEIIKDISPYKLKPGNYIVLFTVILNGTFNLTGPIGQSVLSIQTKFNGNLSGEIWVLKNVIIDATQNQLNTCITIIKPLINVISTDTFTFSAGIEDFGGDSTIAVDSLSKLFLYNFDPINMP